MRVTRFILAAIKNHVLDLVQKQVQQRIPVEFM